MIKKLISSKILLILLVIIVAAGAAIYLDGRKNSITAPKHPEYLNFDGNYVFSVPKNYTIDEQSVLGAQLVYTGQISAKTVEDVYNQNGIAVQVLPITDHSSNGFKDYVNGKYLSELKNNLSTNDVRVKFGKTNGSDNARITVKKDGQASRFLYLKGGQHPAAVVSKQETGTLKTIEQSIIDVERTDLKNESDGIKKSIQNNLQLARAQKAQELYSGAAPELRSQNSQAQLAGALSAAASFLNQNITISGGSYNPGEFSAALRFTSLNKDNQQTALGAITLKKSDGQWKLEALSLPTPK